VAVSEEPVSTTDPRPPWSGYLDALAAPGPEPGGGSAAAVMLALGSALVTMVAGYPASGPSDLTEAGAAGTRLRARAEQLVAGDGAASARLVAAWRGGVREELGPAATAAARSCLDLLAVAREAVAPVELLEAEGSIRVRADVGVAATAYAAAARAAVLTLAGNLELAAGAGVDASVVAGLRAEGGDADRLAERFDAVLARVRHEGT
jgi:methenyltetrahydrofolate cyclohydrolase